MERFTIALMGFIAFLLVMIYLIKHYDKWDTRRTYVAYAKSIGTDKEEIKRYLREDFDMDYEDYNYWIERARLFKNKSRRKACLEEAAFIASTWGYYGVMM